jgi:hypothetical protein
MGLFSPSSTTLEARLADSFEAHRLASAQVATLTDDLQTAVTLASTRETLATQLAADLATERAASATHLATATLASDSLSAAFAPFNFTDEIRATLTPGTIATAIADEIEARAGRRAVELAASQGTPALATDTTTSTPEKDIVATFEAASPEVRAQMFADPITRAALRRANNSV